MNKYIFLIIIFIFFYRINTFSQGKSEINYGIQADITSAIFVTTIGGSVDLDILKLEKEGNLGMRISLENFGYYSVSGTAGGSPFTDIDFLAKLTVEGKLIQVNLCPGITYHTTTDRRNDNGLYLKGAGDVKFKIYKNYIGLLVKFGLSKERYAGIGLFLGFNSKDTK
jgi:hypothetical protein